MFLIAFLFGWAILTCFVSWDVATGTALLNRVTTLEKRIADYDKNASAPGAAATPTPTPSFEARQAEHDRKSLDAARQNLGAWLKSQGFIRKLIKHRMGAAQEEATIAGLPATPSGLTPAETNIQWAVALLSIFASNVLPIFYGLLGAGAAVVRGVSNKVRDSTLTPRDVILAYVQLVLGAVMGLCIGLFVNPASGEGAAQNGLISNSIWLSASALCFVAGFGVDQVFRALEWLIRRIFDPEVPKTTVKP
jgi:hypothetical protein